MLWGKIVDKIQYIKFSCTTRRELSELSEQQLQDIGITREEAQIEAGKSSISGVIKTLFSELKK